jgi:transposase-like protein
MGKVFIRIGGKHHCLWRAVDQDGDVLDILMQKRKDKQAASRFFKKLMKGQGRSARQIVTDKLPSYGRRKKKLCRLQCIAVIGMRITVQRYPMNIREHKNERCGDLNHWARHSDF